MVRFWVALFVLWVGITNVADARTATGYSHGRKTKITLVWVDGVEVEKRTAKAFRKMQAVAKKHGVQLAIRSGFRTHEKQQELYARYRRGWGHQAARPGYSNHQSGRALDIYIDDYDVYLWLKKHAHKYGFKKTVKREAWHWEFVR